MPRANVPHQIEAEPDLERKVGDDERGAGGGDRVERLLRGRGFGADGEIGLVVDQCGEPAPKQGIGVDTMRMRRFSGVLPTGALDMDSVVLSRRGLTRKRVRRASLQLHVLRLHIGRTDKATSQTHSPPRKR